MIYLYKNKLPNYAENTHVFYQEPARFITWLGDPFMTFEEDRYTLNGNVAEVALPAVTDLDDVTYIAWNFGEAWRFFFVRSAVYQSGFGVFTLDVDLWATHIWRAQLSNLRVTRSNKNVGIGVYDPIPVTSGREFARLGDDLTIDDLSIVYVVAFATGVSSILINNAGTSLGVFVSEINKLFPDVVNEDGTTSPNPMNTIDNAIAAVAGITSAAATIGDLDANVIKAYLMPTAYLANKVTEGVPVFNVKAPTFQGSLVPTFEAAPYIFPIAFDIPIDPNYKYFVGTKLAGLELARVTGTARVYYNIITKQDGLQVIVQQGDRMRDITDAFEVGLTNNDGNLTASQKIARTLQVVGGAASGAFQIAQGGVGYVTGALSAANSLTGVIVEGNARYTQGGDGVNTFRLLTGAATSPFYMQKNASVDSESDAARLYGAAFNQVVGSVNYIIDADLLGTGTLTDAFFAAEVRVDGVPADARDVIAGAIRAGIYAIYV